MKKILFAMLFVTTLAGGADADTLVVYFSRTGNTASVAEIIARETDANIFKIVTLDENYYPSDYESTTTKAKQEIADGTLPPIKPVPPLTQYDTVFVGSPIWWGTFAPPVRTFLTQADLSGKKVFPFVTHGTGGAGTSFADIEALTPDSTHGTGFAIAGTSAADSADAIKQWLTAQGVIVAK